MEQNPLGPQPSEVLPESEPVALYVRVSSADQNCQLQLRELRDYAAQSHLRVVGVARWTFTHIHSLSPLFSSAKTALM